MIAEALPQEFCSVTRRFQFCAGHRVHLHESKCANPHGHNYVMMVTVRGPLDPIGRVVDFSVIKDLMGTWIDDNWDHGFIYYERDADMRAMFEGKSWKSFAFGKNPTAENMADYILNAVAPMLFMPHGLLCTAVELWETENCCAVASLPEPSREQITWATRTLQSR